MTRRFAAVVLAAGLVRPAAAHWVTPEEMVAELNTATARDALGIERAVCDTKTPRLLVVRVGDHWYDLPPAVRRTQAADWAEHWRQNVPQGVVSVLDAKTEKPVVRFGRGGAVAAVVERPPGSGGGQSPRTPRPSR